MEILLLLVIVGLLAFREWSGFGGKWLKGKAAQRKGRRGELTVRKMANRFLDKGVYHILNNITLPTEDGSTQIDHVIISVYGVFVIETKNMKGWIFGNAREKYWTQTIFRYKNKFQNPLHQNFKHVRVLQDLLGLTQDQLHSVVVFIGNSTLKTEMPENVVKGQEFISLIKSKTKPVLPESEIEEIEQKILFHSLAPSRITERDHTQHVKQTKRKGDRKMSRKTIRSREKFFRMLICVCFGLLLILSLKMGWVDRLVPLLAPPITTEAPE